MALDLLKALNSGGLTVNQPPTHIAAAPKTQGKVAGTSIVKRYTKPAAQVRTSNNPPIPGPTPPPVAQPPPTPEAAISAPIMPPGTIPPEETYTNELDDYYKGLDTTAPTVDEQGNIREDARKAFQAWIDAVNNEYAGLVANEQAAGQGRLGQTRAINARSGLLGSDFGEANAAETQKYNDANLKALEHEKSTKLAEINSKVDQRARDQIAAEKDTALKNSENYIKHLSESQEDAREDLKTLAKSGAAFDKKRLGALMKQTGYDPLTFESIYNAHKPVPEYRAPVQLKDGTLIMTDSAGNIKNLGKYDLPNNFEFHFAPDGTPMVFDKDTGLTQIAANFHKGQFAKPVAPKSDSQPASVKEFEYAKSQGYTGTFVDYKKKATGSSDDLSWLDNL